MEWNKPGIFTLPKIEDRRGNLTFAQAPDLIPFQINRAYWLYDVPADAERGGHAHRTTQQILIALAGSFCVELFDGFTRRRFTLNRPYQALFIPTGVWRTLDDFSSGSVCLVLASETYLEEEYIRDFDEFMQIATSNGKRLL